MFLESSISTPSSLNVDKPDLEANKVEDTADENPATSTTNPPEPRSKKFSRWACKTAGLGTVILLPLVFMTVFYFDVAWYGYLVTIPAAMFCELATVANFNQHDEKCAESWMVCWHPAVIFCSGRDPMSKIGAAIIGGMCLELLMFVVLLGLFIFGNALMVLRYAILEG